MLADVRVGSKPEKLCESKLTAIKPSLSWPGNLNFGGHITPRIALTVERTIGSGRQIWTGLSALKTQKAGRQNGGGFFELGGMRFRISHRLSSVAQTVYSTGFEAVSVEK